jgi:hypothetical protein
MQHRVEVASIDILRVRPTNQLRSFVKNVENPFSEPSRNSLNHLVILWNLFNLGLICWMGSNIKVFMFWLILLFTFRMILQSNWKFCFEFAVVPEILKGACLCSLYILRIIDIMTILGALANLRKVNICFFISARLSAWSNSVPTGRIFMKFNIWIFYQNLSREIKFD